MISELTSKDDRAACALTDKIISESEKSDKWYAFFEDFADLLSHPKSLVRNRAINLIAANLRWDKENRFESIMSAFLSHITDEKPITSRQCVKALSLIGQTKPEYIPVILEALEKADLSGYKDSMPPLFQKDIEETKKALT